MLEGRADEKEGSPMRRDDLRPTHRRCGGRRFADRRLSQLAVASVRTRRVLANGRESPARPAGRTADVTQAAGGGLVEDRFPLQCLILGPARPGKELTRTIELARDDESYSRTPGKRAYPQFPKSYSAVDARESQKMRNLP